MSTRIRLVLDERRSENVPDTFTRPLNVGDTYEERDALDLPPRRVFRITGPAKHVVVGRTCVSYYPAEIVED